ncbi:hypothetical protein [Cellulosimicrobium sp. Marseille-Q4280]|uniref:hypothetical protein n=1 Tax=Cellulosimicrobium sp. Marseille-Q4280 TaxID=2937992 RepID=UPI002041D1F5|nr:hypothetical protein [Cellulosimicrobium sp. Marseille-Q4280]
MPEQATQRYETPVKITDVFLGFEGHGIFTMTLTVDFGGSQAMIGGYNLQGDTGFAAAFIRGVLQATGSNDITQIKGKTVLLISRNDRHSASVGALGIKQMPFDGGSEFLFDEAAARYR